MKFIEVNKMQFALPEFLEKRKIEETPRNRADVAITILKISIMFSVFRAMLKKELSNLQKQSAILQNPKAFNSVIFDLYNLLEFSELKENTPKVSTKAKLKEKVSFHKKEVTKTDKKSKLEMMVAKAYDNYEKMLRALVFEDAKQALEFSGMLAKIAKIIDKLDGSKLIDNTSEKTKKQSIKNVLNLTVEVAAMIEAKLKKADANFEDMRLENLYGQQGDTFLIGANVLNCLFALIKIGIKGNVDLEEKKEEIVAVLPDEDNKAEVKPQVPGKINLPGISYGDIEALISQRNKVLGNGRGRGVIDPANSNPVVVNKDGLRPC